MLLDLVFLFLILIISSFAIPFIGLSFIRLKNNLSSVTLNSFFISICLGLIIVVTFFSIYITRGKTINIFFIPLLISFLAIQNKEPKKVNISFFQFHKNYRIEYLIFLIFSILFFVIMFFLYAFKQKYFIRLPHPDIIHYSKISNYFLTHKIENAKTLYFSQDTSLLPYHYFEIWLNSFFSFVSNKSPLYTFIFLAYPIGFSTVAFGFFSILKRKFNQTKIVFIIFSILIIFWTGLSNINFPINNFFDASSLFCRNLFVYPKLFIAYIFIIGIIISIQNKEYGYCFLFTVFASVSSITLMIPIAISSVITFLYFYLIKKNKLICKELIKYLLFFFLISLFYLFNSNMDDALLKSTKTSIFDIFNISKLKTGFNIVVKTNLQLIFIYIPTLILLILNYEKIKIFLDSKKTEIIILFITLISSLLTWALFCTTIDSVQFFNNLSIPILNIISLLIFYFLLFSKNKKNKYVAICLFLFNITFNFNHNLTEINFTQKYNEQSLLSISKKISTKDNPIGVFIRDKSDFIGNGIFERFSILGQYTSALQSKNDFISLSVFDIPLDTNSYYYTFEKGKVINSVFYKYVLDELKNGRFKNKNQIKVDFINKNKIDFLITSKNTTLPKELNRLVKDSVIETISGERFYILK